MTSETSRPSALSPSRSANVEGCPRVSAVTIVIDTLSSLASCILEHLSGRGSRRRRAQTGGGWQRAGSASRVWLRC
jgi:hypothetical protein